MNRIHQPPFPGSNPADATAVAEECPLVDQGFESLSVELRCIADALLDPTSGAEARGKAVERLIQFANALAQKGADAMTPVAPDTRRAFASLSPREREIFAALGEGLTVNDIAMRLNRSPKTINNHRTHVMHKLKLRNAAELTRLAIRLGIATL
ncbi:MAG TPA: LuxR C-terminal-related transcriptional regulator [Gammaproteobacteria bacterium]